MGTLEEREKAKRFNALVVKAKAKENEGRFMEALEFYEQAYLLFPLKAKLGRKIDSISGKIGGKLQLLEGKYQADVRVYRRLYVFQRKGVDWMLKLYSQQSGGILGDDMGLGKTVQTCVFLHSLFTTNTLTKVLLVVPKSVVHQWERQLKQWEVSTTLVPFYDSNCTDNHAFSMIPLIGGICITCYSLIALRAQLLSFEWDCIILDEGHKVKNENSQLSRSIQRLRGGSRFVLTGTALQNNLKELWVQLDWVSKGKVLGPYNRFKKVFEDPIVSGQDQNSSMYEKELSRRALVFLRETIDPIYLRREKENVESEDNTLLKVLQDIEKIDLTVWLKLSEIQSEMYKDVCHTYNQNDISRDNSFEAMTQLQKICNFSISDESHENSCKIKFIQSLLPDLYKHGHRVLLFTKCKTVLSQLETVLTNLNLSHIRLDGSLSTSQRASVLDSFTTDTSLFCMILTVQVGGLGLNLFSADRVILFDPHWNPSVDEQAVDRCFRVGQTRNVVIYRLITSGTIEEMVYRKQVHKSNLTISALSRSKSAFAYFSREEMKKVFMQRDLSNSKTLKGLQMYHNTVYTKDPHLNSHIQFLKSLDTVGIGNHADLFSASKERDISSLLNSIYL